MFVISEARTTHIKEVNWVFSQFELHWIRCICWIRQQKFLPQGMMWDFQTDPILLTSCPLISSNLQNIVYFLKMLLMLQLRIQILILRWTSFNHAFLYFTRIIFILFNPEFLYYICSEQLLLNVSDSKLLAKYLHLGRHWTVFRSNAV